MHSFLLKVIKIILLIGCVIGCHLFKYVEDNFSYTESELWRGPRTMRSPLIAAASRNYFIVGIATADFECVTSPSRHNCVTVFVCV